MASEESRQAEAKNQEPKTGPLTADGFPIRDSLDTRDSMQFPMSDFRFPAPVFADLVAMASSNHPIPFRTRQ